MYLGGFDSEEQAALAYDLAAIKCRGEDAQTNFSIHKYSEELKHVDEVRSSPSSISGHSPLANRTGFFAPMSPCKKQWWNRWPSSFPCHHECLTDDKVYKQIIHRARSSPGHRPLEL